MALEYGTLQLCGIYAALRENRGIQASGAVASSRCMCRGIQIAPVVMASCPGCTGHQIGLFLYAPSQPWWNPSLAYQKLTPGTAVKPFGTLEAIADAVHGMYEGYMDSTSSVNLPMRD